MGRTDWYDTQWGQAFYWGFLVLTVIGVGVSMITAAMRIPGVVYLFGFLGATVYVFTSFAKRFDADGRYRLKIVSRTVAVLPLAAGVYLLAFAFSGISGQLSALQATGTNGTTVTTGDRVVAGLVFLAGIYVSATLQALGRLAERLLGLDSGTDGAADAEDSENDG